MSDSGRLNSPDPGDSAGNKSNDNPTKDNESSAAIRKENEDNDVKPCKKKVELEFSKTTKKSKTDDKEGDDKLDVADNTCTLNQPSSIQSKEMDKRKSYTDQSAMKERNTQYDMNQDNVTRTNNRSGSGQISTNSNIQNTPKLDMHKGEDQTKGSTDLHRSTSTEANTDQKNTQRPEVDKQKVKQPDKNDTESAHENYSNALDDEEKGEDGEGYGDEEEGWSMVSHQDITDEQNEDINLNKTGGQSVENGKDSTASKPEITHTETLDDKSSSNKTPSYRTPGHSSDVIDKTASDITKGQNEDIRCKKTGGQSDKDGKGSTLSKPEITQTESIDDKSSSNRTPSQSSDVLGESPSESPPNPVARTAAADITKGQNEDIRCNKTGGQSDKDGEGSTLSKPEITQTESIDDKSSSNRTPSQSSDVLGESPLESPPNPFARTAAADIADRQNEDIRLNKTGGQSVENGKDGTSSKPAITQTETLDDKSSSNKTPSHRTPGHSSDVIDKSLLQSLPKPAARKTATDQNGAQKEDPMGNPTYGEPVLEVNKDNTDWEKQNLSASSKLVSNMTDPSLIHSEPSSVRNEFDGKVRGKPPKPTPRNKPTDQTAMAFGNNKNDVTDKPVPKVCAETMSPVSDQVNSACTSKYVSEKSYRYTFHFVFSYEHIKSKVKESCDHEYDIDDYMKLNYVFQNVNLLSQKTEVYSGTCTLTLCKNEVNMQLGVLKERLDVEAFVKLLLSDTGYLTVRTMDLGDIEGNSVIDELNRMPEAQDKELVSFFEPRNNKLYIVYNVSEGKNVERVLNETFKKPHSTSSKVLKSYPLPWVWKQKLCHTECISHIKNNWPSLNFTVVPLDSENITKICLEGNFSDTEAALMWLNNLLKQYAVGCVEYKSIPDVRLFEDKHEVLHNFMKFKFPDGKIVYDINTTKQSVWFLSEESQRKADQACQILLDCIKHSEIAKCVVIPYPEKANLKESINAMAKKISETYSDTTKTEIDETGIIVSGLTKHVKEIEEKMSTLIRKYETESSDVEKPQTNGEKCQIVKTVIEVQLDEVRQVDEWAHTCEKAFDGRVQIEKLRSVPNDSEKTERELVVRVVKEDITAVKADAVVITIGKDLDHETGPLFSGVSKAAGKEYLSYLKSRYPHLKGDCKVLSTPSYDLRNCRHILHGTLDSYQYDQTSEPKQILLSFVIKCIREADGLKCKSIAFPAIGTGNLKYPKCVVAEVMFGAIKTILEQPQSLLYLTEIMFAIYAKDYDSQKEFQKQEKLFSSYMRCKRSEVKIKNIVVRLDIGSISNPRKDCLIYLWEKKCMPNVAYQTHELLGIAGKLVQSKFTTHRQGEIKNEMLMTPSAEIPVANILHVPCDDRLDDVMNKTAQALKIVSNVSSIRTVSIGFDKKHPFLRYGTKLAETVLDAVFNFSTVSSEISEINLLVEGSTEMVSSLENAFKSVLERIGTKQQVKVQVRITGMETDVRKAAEEMKAMFQTCSEIGEKSKEEEQVTNGFNGQKKEELEPPEGQEMDRLAEAQTMDDGSRKQVKPSEETWHHGRLTKWDELQRYVCIRTNSKSRTVKSLEKELSECLKSIIGEWKLVFCDYWEKGIIICRNSTDAVKLRSKGNINGLSLEDCDRTVIGNFEFVIDRRCIRSLKGSNVYDTFMAKLGARAIEVLQKNPMKLKMPTKYQLLYVRETLAQFLPLESSQDQYAIVDYVDKPVFEILESVRETFGFSLSYDDERKCLRVEFSEDAGSDAFEKAQSFLEGLKNKDYCDIPVSKENFEMASAFCQEMGQKVGFFVQDQSKIICAYSSYDEYYTFKHKYEIRIGTKKQSSRSGRNIDTNLAANEEKNRSGRSAEKYTSTKKSSIHNTEAFLSPGASNVRKYPVSNTLMVYVYEADILSLNVKCIVNAANKYLSHGGGVAAVIERAAGYSLKKEGDDYVKTNGPLQVGKACTTNAGRLPYGCVIHTVGPDWQDYRPHSVQKVQQCETDLYNAIYNSFRCAEEKKFESIALPAISSAIFKVPEDLCVYQYARATIDYSVASVGKPTALKEIHFVDKNGEIVRKIQNSFASLLNGTAKYDTKQFVEPSTLKKSNTSSDSYKYKGNQSQSQDVGANAVAADVPLPSPLGFEDERLSQYTVLLCGDAANQKLIISKDNIFAVTASCIVVSVNENGQLGKIGGALLAQMRYGSDDYLRKLSSQTHNAKEGSVFLTEGFDTKFSFMLHVVIPRKRRSASKAKELLAMVYDRMFSVLHDKKIESVATSLIGTDPSSSEQLEIFCKTFLESYLLHCKKTFITGNEAILRVSLVCRESFAFDTTRDFFNNYVTTRKEDKKNELIHKNDTSGKQTGVTQTMDVANEGEKEDCVICMDVLKEPSQLDCGHRFCKSCIEEQFKHRKACPTCGKVMGIITGNQPEGKMDVYFSKYYHCAGYEKYGRIDITYSLFGGYQKENHPNPGKYYKGITRRAYLPDNEEGNVVLKMLKVAFERKLVFTIGISRTTGEEGVITWNDIHHKTDPLPGKQFGYPDSDYLNRVKDELSVKGVTVNDIQ